MASATSNNESAQSESENAPASTVSPQVKRSGRSLLRTLTGVQIIATGSYVPEEIVRNEDLAKLGYDADWIVQRTGIHERRRAPKGMATSDMASRAALHCLEQANVSPEEIDLLIVGTFTPDTPAPSTACRVQNELGITAPAMDLNAACAGFIYSLVTGMQFVASGCSRRALIIGADTLSRIINPADKKTYPLFGDAAGAVLLGKGEQQQGLTSYTLGSDGSGSELLCVPAGGSREPITGQALADNRHFLQMDGRPVFKWAIRMLADTARDVLAESRLSVEEIDLVLFHQANIRIIDAAIDDLGIDRQKVVINLDRYGNTSAGSIPLVLDEAYRAGRIARGDNILVSGFGAGLSWGTAILKW